MLRLWRLKEGCRNVFKSSPKRYLSTAKSKLTEDVEEIKIPVPWGHVAGKWWGSKSSQPILCLHGWQDNANTFDTLIPQLAPDQSYLAVDLPGHGLSSHFPKGVFYSIQDSVCVIRRIQMYFGWPKISLLGHSFGAASSFVFSSCYSESVDFFIAIDILKPVSKNVANDLKKGSKGFEKMLAYDARSVESAPLYSKSMLLERWIKGTDNSLTPESCEILMKRGTEEINGLLRLNRDGRVKQFLSPAFTQKENLELAETIKCNVLFVKASGSPYYEKKEDVLDVMNVIKRNARHFEHHELPGTHHLHLNNPEIVAPIIKSFIKTVGGGR